MASDVSDGLGIPTTPITPTPQPVLIDLNAERIFSFTDVSILLSP
jgi:hypothetical protein